MTLTYAVARANNDQWERRGRCVPAGGVSTAFSVIVPVHNAGEYLRRCLDSIAGQTYRDMEVILVDDGSTDGSGQVCDEYARRYPFVAPVVHQENRGVSAARNRGLELATGQWLVFVDSDDWVREDMLERVMGCILATDPDVCRFDCHTTSDERGEELSSPPQRAGHNVVYSLPDGRSKFHFCISRRWGGVVRCAAYRHSIVRELGLRFRDIPLVFPEDSLFNYLYILRARRVACMCDRLYFWRERGDSLSHTISARQEFLGQTRMLEAVREAAAREGYTYFLRHFHRLYFMRLNNTVLHHSMTLSDEELRRLLDELWEMSALHRTCIRKFRRQWWHFAGRAQGVYWFWRGFGHGERSRLWWRARLLWLSVCEALGDKKKKDIYRYYMDEERHVAYLENYKAACTSIRVSMLRRDDIPDDYSVFSVAQSVHMGGHTFGHKDWFTFSFVRNPFARLVSCYESKYHSDRVRYRDAIRRGWLVYDVYLNGYLRQDKGFDHFVRRVIDIPHCLDDGYIRSQYRLLVGKGGKPVVDFIGKVENMEADYEPIRRRYGYGPLRRYNQSGHSDWRDYYTTELARMVYGKYKDDVRYFGYEGEYEDLLAHCAGRGV